LTLGTAGSPLMTIAILCHRPLPASSAGLASALASCAVGQRPCWHHLLYEGACVLRCILTPQQRIEASGLVVQGRADNA